MKPILFLDIDGVLNDHTYHQPADSTTIDKPCVDRLNKIIEETGCQVVVSSAWRYMVIKGSMTVDGLHNLLRTHGVTKHLELIGITDPDEVDVGMYVTGSTTRGRQIAAWMATHGKGRTYCIVDDLDLDISNRHGDKFVRTQGSVGMTDEDMNKIIEKLKV